MRRIKQKILKVTAVLADSNAKAKDKSTDFCPAFFYQPRRPKKRITNRKQKGDQ